MYTKEAFESMTSVNES